MQESTIDQPNNKLTIKIVVKPGASVNAYTEAEQIELLKRWWGEYGTAAIIGIILALILGFGWRYWQQHHEQQLAHVSMRYEELLTSVVNGNTDAVENNANGLIERYPHTAYTQLAALQLARQDVYQNKLADAETKLTWVRQHGDDPALREVARLRAARVYLADNQAQKALDVLNKIDDKAYQPVALEVQGDVYAAMGQNDKARDAYQQALKALPEFAVMQPLLQMKLDNLPAATTGAK